MADYFEPTVIQPTIPDADMTPLERLLLSHIFQSERHDDDGWYFFAEECPDTMIVVDRASLAAALAETRADDSSVHAYVAEQLASAAEDDEIDLDLSGTSWEFMLQDIVKRSATLDHVTAVSALTCSRMRPDGFGGMAVLITADAIQGKSTNDILGELLDQAEHGAPGAAPGFGVHVLLRLSEAAVRAAIPEIVGADPDLTKLAAADVTEADVRAGCLAVVERIDLREDHAVAVFNAALAAIRAAEARRTIAP